MSSSREPLVSVEQALDHAERLLAERPAAALQQCAEILAAVPGHPQALLIQARALRLSGQLAAARAVLEPLFAAQPASASVAMELGIVAYRMGDVAAAIAPLRRAVSLRPGFAEAWNALADALRATGDEAGADQAYLASVCSSANDALMMKAALALSDGRLAEAEPLLRARLKERPTDVAAIRMLAELAGRIGRYRDACVLLERVVELAPSFAAGRHNLALALHRQGRTEEALTTLAPLLESDPHNPAYLNLKAAILTRCGDHEPAAAIYREVLERFPKQPKIWMSLGHVLKTIGRQAEAIGAYRQAIALQPTLGEAWWSLANLKTFRFSTTDVAAMKAALTAPELTAEDRFHLEFALGKAEEDEGHFEEAFAWYVAGNRGRRAMLDYDPSDFAAFVRVNKRIYSREFFVERAGWGCDAADPIFVVSLPRSGSTLIEQILASHSQIEGTAELPHIPALVSRIGPTRIATLSRDEVRALGEEYLRQCRIQRKTARPYFVDKLPNNWAHLGFIRLILPNARIIDARRHPLDCCLSNFKQHFARGQAFTYDLTEIGLYYRNYVEWMAHVDNVLPRYVHRVFYEAMVEQLEAQIRAMLDYLGLPFEESCLTFHETSRPIATASSEQVRRPIFRDGLNSWNRFDSWLGPLKAALGPVLSAYPEVPSL